MKNSRWSFKVIFSGTHAETYTRYSEKEAKKIREQMEKLGTCAGRRFKSLSEIKNW